MVAELVRRLSQAGVVSRDALAESLVDATIDGVHFLQKLAERHASIVPSLDAELARVKGPSVTVPLAIDAVQVLRLPPGLCRRLLAVPLQVEPTSAHWAIAVADPSDRHVAAEISYHLGGPVDVFRAPLSAILNAVALGEGRLFDASEMPLMDAVDEHTPAFGTAAIKLVRRSSAHWSFGEIASEVGRPLPRRGLSLPPIQAAAQQSEPPIPLIRPLGSRAPEVREPVPAAAAIETAMEASNDHPASPNQELPRPSGITTQERTAEILDDLESKQSPREVLLGLAQAVSMVARRSAVFVVRAGRFHLEALFPSKPARSFSMPSSEPSVLRIACQAGYYLGALQRGAYFEELAGVLEIAVDGEVYIVPVVVAERPAALIVAGLIDNTFAATRLIDQVAKRGGGILEWLVQKRRQGNRA